MIQEIIIAVLFLGALGYVGYLVYASFQAKNSCATACGKCGAIDFDKIEKQIVLQQQKSAGRKH